MKKLISNYTFNSASKTIIFNDYGKIDLERILLITNVTSNDTIYLFNSSALNGTVANNSNMITLTYDTTSMNSTDKLQIFYDDFEESQLVNATSTDEQIKLLSRIVKLLESNSIVDSAQRQRIIVDAGVLTTVSTVSTVSSVTGVTAITNLQQLAGYDHRQFIDIARNSYANSIRSKLNFN